MDTIALRNAAATESSVFDSNDLLSSDEPVVEQSDDNIPTPTRPKSSVLTTLKALAVNEVWWAIGLLMVLVIGAVVGTLIWFNSRKDSGQALTWRSYIDPGTVQYFCVIVGGVFGCIAIMMSAVQIIQHWRHWKHPSQKRMTRIIMLVPIWAVTAWLALAILNIHLYMSFIQSCYEAYAIYSFTILLTKFCGGHYALTDSVKTKEPIKWLWPLNYFLPAVRSADYWVWSVKLLVLQYSWLAPLTSFAAVIANAFNLYGDGDFFDVTKAYIYLAVVINTSQMVAIYALIWLYEICKHELAPFKPVAKFLSIKLLVFFTFWQSLLIAGLADINVLHYQVCDPTFDQNCSNGNGLTVSAQKVLLDNLIILIELFLFACAHHWVFSYRQYENGDYVTLMEAREANALNRRPGCENIKMTSTKRIVQIFHPDI